ncbi:MAG: type II toxin-antitoxin system VapC family toxin [Pseudomonadota bacterium]
MTSYLVDTNAFAMFILGDRRFSEPILERMKAATNLAVSVISLYEIGQKVRLGKWPQMSEHVDDLERTTGLAGFDLLPLSGKASLKAASLNWDHRDPFDRMIAAVALIEGMALISSDRAFDNLELARYWD